MGLKTPHNVIAKKHPPAPLKGGIASAVVKFPLLRGAGGMFEITVQTRK